MDDSRKILYDYLIELTTQEAKDKLKAEVQLEIDKLFNKEDVDA